MLMAAATGDSGRRRPARLLPRWSELFSRRNLSVFSILLAAFPNLLSHDGGADHAGARLTLWARGGRLLRVATSAYPAGMLAGLPVAGPL